MERKYQFDPVAVSELEEIAIWHEKNRTNSGVELVQNVYEKAEQITKRPYSYSVNEEGVRRAGIKKFPYFLYYIFQKPIVVILAIWHKKRNQNDWKTRLNKYSSEQE